ncbi:hypothetical protein FHW58_001549 [Duganella sp. 1224]|uniref:S8 family serine peptidase n=1 Tax=Duganella sp. 1224 TaxID=2587052 RepID=UPI0015CAD8EE|nr:S8 family serine peptidase [Duganella sp. 1224]NYE60397.1 hypothetical protein [Duganella sp. 1224]
MKTTHLTPLLALLLAGATGLAQAQHAKLDAGLSDLVDQLKTPAVARQAVVAGPQATHEGLTDSNGRVLVDLYLDGQRPLDAVVASLQAAGAQVTGVNAAFRRGAVSAYVPPNQIEGLAATAGLRVMKLSLRPQRNVGVTTSQGTKVLHSDAANAAGITGTGITVGVLSDSYDGSPASFTTIRAANDIASGDLRTPKFVIDLVDRGNTDEGRAMMQIVQDVAPGADLCFATAFAGEAAFADNIRTLRTHPSCRADVIVDDVFYYDEPFFSDGQVAQAVNDVVTSTTLAGKPVSYFSSAGNQGAAGGGGAIDVPNATFSTTPANLGNINLASVSTCSSSPVSGSTKANVGGGWLDFGGGTYVTRVNYTPTGSRMVMQWDDPFYAGAVSTDLNLYFFNDSGTCVFTFASNNLATDNGMEYISLSGGAGLSSLRIMVGRTSAGAHTASRVRLVNFDGFDGGPFDVRTSPVTFGHSAAVSANSVAAYRYTNPVTQVAPYKPVLEPFSSPGPVVIALDADGNRLPVAEQRKKPDMAAPDGGDTTFFYPGQDFEGNGRPNFFGTSAAAPHAAGVAALLLQKAGGPGKLTPKQVKSLLQTSAPARVPPYSPAGTAATRTWSLYDGFGLIDATATLNKLP